VLLVQPYSHIFDSDYFRTIRFNSPVTPTSHLYTVSLTCSMKKKGNCPNVSLWWKAGEC
jgi:hypothetical protein